MSLGPSHPWEPPCTRSSSFSSPTLSAFPLQVSTSLKSQVKCHLLSEALPKTHPPVRSRSSERVAFSVCHLCLVLLADLPRTRLLQCCHAGLVTQPNLRLSCSVTGTSKPKTCPVPPSLQRSLLLRGHVGRGNPGLKCSLPVYRVLPV